MYLAFKILIFVLGLVLIGGTTLVGGILLYDLLGFSIFGLCVACIYIILVNAFCAIGLITWLREE